MKKKYRKLAIVLIALLVTSLFSSCKNDEKTTDASGKTGKKSTSAKTAIKSTAKTATATGTSATKTGEIDPAADGSEEQQNTDENGNGTDTEGSNEDNGDTTDDWQKDTPVDLGGRTIRVASILARDLPVAGASKQ